MKFLLPPTVTVAAALLLGSLALPHGSVYTPAPRGPASNPPSGWGGPGDITPSTPLTGGAKPPAPSTPSTPPTGPIGPSQPLTGGPHTTASGVSTVGAAATGAGSAMPQAADWTGWHVWWEFNKHPFLELKSHVHSGDIPTGSDDFFLGFGERRQPRDLLRPSERQVRERVVPALLAALERESSHKIRGSVLIALAKIGEPAAPDGRSYLQQVFVEGLGDTNLEVRETSTLALGILAHDRCADPLLELVGDTYEARKRLVRDSSVSLRMRALAAYGLGLVGRETASEDVRRRIVARLAETLADESTATQDLGVACVIALGLVPLATIETPDEAQDAEPGPEASRLEQIRFLRALGADASADVRVRAHVPGAVVRLLRGLEPEHRDPLEAALAEAWLPQADRRTTSERAEVVEGIALALGELADLDDDPVDRAIRGALAAPEESFVQPQARHFALVSLATTGGTAAGPGAASSAEGLASTQRALLETLARGSTRLRRWAALGLGVFGRRLQGAGVVVPPELGSALRAALEGARSPEDVGAYAVALGILGDAEARPLLLSKLEATNEERARGYVAVALGMLGADEAAEPIGELVREARYRPLLLRESAVALGLLGDKSAVTELVGMLGESKSLASQAAIATALGHIGDARSVDPLIWMLESERHTESARSFAAVSLGSVCDRRPLPWIAPISVGVHYGARTPTLLSEGLGELGILEIL